MKPIAFLLAAVAGSLGLASCETYDPPTSAVTFGEAVQRNVELQVVNPEPLVDAEPTGLDGHRAALAIARYQADRVKPPEELRATEVGAVGGGGGAGGGLQ